MLFFLAHTSELLLINSQAAMVTSRSLGRARQPFPSPPSPPPRAISRALLPPCQFSRVARRAAGLPEAGAATAREAGGRDTGNPALDALLDLGDRLRDLFGEGRDAFGLPADNHWTLATSVGEILLYAANSGALASRDMGLRGGGGGGGAASVLPGADPAAVTAPALALAEAVRANLAAGADSVHGAALGLFQRLDHEVLTLNPKL